MRNQYELCRSDQLRLVVGIVWLLQYHNDHYNHSGTGVRYVRLDVDGVGVGNTYLWLYRCVRLRTTEFAGKLPRSTGNVELCLGVANFAVCFTMVLGSYSPSKGARIKHVCQATYWFGGV